jgi:alkaline phosphatase D
VLLFALVSSVGLLGCPRSKSKKGWNDLNSPSARVSANKPKVPAVARLTHGPGAFEVGPHQAWLWARSNRDGHLNVSVKLGTTSLPKPTPVLLKKENDFSGAVLVKNLSPATHYSYRIWVSREPYQEPDDKHPALEGSFQTAPENDQAQALRFAWGGDVGGQNVCRDAKRGYPIFKEISKAKPDFFLGLGDLIYADDVCKAMGTYRNKQVPGKFSKSYNLETYYAHWRYNREEENTRKLYANTATFSVWDDHEVRNDFGPNADKAAVPPAPPNLHLLPLGLHAFLAYNPLGTPDPSDPKRLYRKFQWGKHLELFALDTRQYRDANTQKDEDKAPKTMLGAAQKAWFEKEIVESKATWKGVISSVPIAIPTGSNTLARDGWAGYLGNTGFEHELRDILKVLHDKRVKNVFFLSTDVHFVSIIRFNPFQDGYSFHEFISGPLNAGMFNIKKLDTSFHPKRLFYHAPPQSAPETYIKALDYFNFGLVEIDKNGVLVMKIINANGKELYSLNLLPDK